MSLMARVSLTGPPADSPEDFLFSALSVIFPDDATNQHGDAEHGVLYTSPHLPEPLHLSLADPTGESDRKLFSHYLWNSSLMLAKLIEAGTLEGSENVPGTKVATLRGSGPVPVTEADTVVSAYCQVHDFDVAGLSTLELGAGTALPSILAALFGAERVTITDYPSEIVLDNLRANLMRNVKRESTGAGIGVTADSGGSKGQRRLTKNPLSTAIVTVDGHEWGQFNTDLAKAGHHAYDRLFVCDCLWMPWQHDNLRKSIDWFLKRADMEQEGHQTRLSSPRCWVVAGFHTGREKVAAFFDEPALATVNLEVETIWERDCDDAERPWVKDRGIEDSTERKRWLCIAILRRISLAHRSKGLVV